MKLLIITCSITLFIGLMISETLKGQLTELEKYKWRNRLVLINAENEESAEYKHQINEFYGYFDELKERKLVLVLVKRNKYKTISFEEATKVESDWSNSDLLYQKYMKKKSDFRVILIGLDGGVKLSQKEVLTKTALFGRIDSMPMRQAEIQAKENISK